MTYQRIMGLDFGDKRIGIALSDPFLLTAQGVESYTRQGEAADIEYIRGICKKSNVKEIVCGLPKNMNGTMGPQAGKVKEFATRLQNKVGIPVVFEDERLTTVFAERVLLEADVSRKKRRKVIDKLAAIAILQGYLDRKSCRKGDLT